MKEHPILFSTPMVQAILEGRKTQTRRIIKLRNGELPDDDEVSFHRNLETGEIIEFDKIMDFSKTYPYWQELKCPYGQPGDLLWVRETFCDYNEGWVEELKQKEPHFIYKADEPLKTVKGIWKPSIHMPKAAARIWLKIKNVKVERVQEISRGDCMAEGCPFPNIAKETNPKIWFTYLWEKINGAASWYANPWVWVIEFEVISTNGKLKEI